jgi:hypothetical protein
MHLSGNFPAQQAAMTKNVKDSLIVLDNCITGGYLYLEGTQSSW